MLNLKKGNSSITTPIIIVLSLIVIIFVGVYIIKITEPFIWYEKLNTIATKYMFIIEKYGYLTNFEKNNLIDELNLSGFDINNIDINVPNNIKNYGELIEFSIKYNFTLNLPSFGNKNESKKNIQINVRKNSYCKK